MRRDSPRLVFGERDRRPSSLKGGADL